jgi:ribosome-binding factor A
MCMIIMGRRLFFKRADRVGDAIRREISEMLIRGIKDPRVAPVTITRVHISDDLRAARVYFSVMGSETDRKESIEGLNSAKGYIKREMGRRIHLRYVPDLVFEYDSSVEYADHINRLIKSLQHEEEPREEG